MTHIKKYSSYETHIGYNITDAIVVTTDQYSKTSIKHNTVFTSMK